jgi:hypothetical protein
LDPINNSPKPCAAEKNIWCILTVY